MDSRRHCEIIWTDERGASGWKWRPLAMDAARPACRETYALFYECVLAARASGYSLQNLKCA
jgi:hypothetical protein